MSETLNLLEDQRVAAGRRVLRCDKVMSDRYSAYDLARVAYQAAKEDAAALDYRIDVEREVVRRLKESK